MKSCEEFAPLLSAMIDGELTEEIRAEVAAHLESCEACRERLAEVAAMSAALTEAYPEAEVPEGFTEGVMERVRAEKFAQKRGGKRRVWRRAMPIAACAALVLCAAAMFPGMSRMNETADTAAPEMVYNGAAMLTADSAAEADGVDDEAVTDTELARDSYELVQSSAYSGDSLSSMPKMAEDDGAVYFCEAREIGGEEGLLWCEENGAVLLTLRGENATEYIEENGGVADGAGYYYLPVSALYALPDSITLSDAQGAALAEIPEEAEWALVYPNDLGEGAQE